MDWGLIVLISGIIIGSASIIHGFYNLYKKKEDKTSIVIEVIVGLALITLPIGNYFGDDFEQKKKATYGKFTPKNNTIYEINGRRDLNIALIGYGERQSFITSRESKNILGGDDLEFFDTGISLSWDANGILSKGKVPTPSGKILAELIDNEWIINESEYFKRNYDSHAIEIVDSEGIIKIQLDYLYKNVIVFSGFFRQNDRSYVEVSNGVKFLSTNGKEEARKHSDQIPLMFKYPSDTYFGERVTKIERERNKTAEKTLKDLDRLLNALKGENRQKKRTQNL